MDQVSGRRYDQSVDPVAPSQPRPKAGALLLRCCLVAAALGVAAVAGLVVLSERQAAELKRKSREAAVRSVELVVSPDAKLAFRAPGKNGIADLVVVGGLGSTNHEIEEPNYKKIRALLAPLGPVKAVEVADVRDVQPPGAAPMHPGGLVVEGTLVFEDGRRRRFVARSSYRDLTMARWASLESIELAEDGPPR